jgi:hypothetical protein
MSAAESEKSPVQAWVRLRPKHPSQDTASAEDTQVSTHAIVERVTQRVGHQAHSVKVLPNLGSFIVSASPAFLRELAHQPEVESTKSTDQPMTLIRPVKSRDVTLARPKRVTPRKPSRRRRPKK